MTYRYRATWQQEILNEFALSHTVRYRDPLNKKRFAIPYKDAQKARDKMAQLKRDGVKEIEVTKDVLKRGVKFKEQYELQEAKFAVKLSFLPKPIYVDSESAGKVKMAMRKALKKPEDIESVERVMPADYKADLRNRIKGKKDDEDGEDDKKEEKKSEKKETKEEYTPRFSVKSQVVFSEPEEVVEETISDEQFEKHASNITRAHKKISD